jgi:hypothetical protein
LSDDYYQRNKEQIKQRVRNYRVKNREVILERKRKYNAEHAVERLEKQKAYASAHPNEIKQYFNGYYEKNGEHIREHVNKMKKVNGEKLEEEIRKLFPNLVCHFCGRTDIQARLGVSFHKKDGEPHNYHTIQRLRLIIAHPEEFVPLCRMCHHTVHHMMMQGFVWAEIDRLITEKRKETGEEKLKILYEEMLTRLRRNAWMKEKLLNAANAVKLNVPNEAFLRQLRNLEKGLPPNAEEK